MSNHWIVASAFALITAGVYIGVGRAVQTRATSPSNYLANLLFAVWWYGLGATTAITAGLHVAAHNGFHDLDAFVAANLLLVFLVCMALWGLLYYLVFLFTGRAAILGPLTLFYVGVFFALVYHVVRQMPDGLTIGTWSTQLHYASPAGRDLLFGAVLLLVLAPQILAAVAFFALYFRVDDPTQRFRVAVVSWSILIWFGSSFVASVGQFAQSPAWQVASRLIGLGAALAIFAAYRPPMVLRRRLAAATARLEMESGGPPRPRAARAAPRRDGQRVPSRTA